MATIRKRGQRWFAEVRRQKRGPGHPPERAEHDRRVHSAGEEPLGEEGFPELGQARTVADRNRLAGAACAGKRRGEEDEDQVENDLLHCASGPLL